MALQFYTTQPTNDRDSEIVTDSEPEREERRRRAKELKKRTRRPLQSAKVNAEIIELTDSSEPEALPLRPTQANAVPPADEVVEIIGTRIEPLTRNDREPQLVDTRNNTVQNASSNTFFPSVGEILDPHRSPWREMTVPMPSPSTQQPSQDGRFSVLSLPSSSSKSAREPTATDSEADPDSDCNTKRMNIAQFAYTINDVRRTTSIASSSRSVSFIDTERCAPAKKVPRLAAHSLSDAFPASDLARLLKCVCCDLSWTARKTAPQKMKHIQLCAKKNALTHETVIILIRKELEVAPPPGTAQTNSKSACSKEQDNARTLLEDVLVADGAKKKKRRVQVVGTVQSLQDTRGQILDRARRLIGDATPATGDAVALRQHHEPSARSMPPATQVFGASGLASGQDASAAQVPGLAFPPTQVFAPSKFVEVEDDMPPATQGFGKRALATGLDGAVTRTQGLPSQMFGPSKFARDAEQAPCDIDSESTHDRSGDAMHSLSFRSDLLPAARKSPSTRSQRAPAAGSSRQPARYTRVYDDTTSGGFVWHSDAESSCSPQVANPANSSVRRASRAHRSTSPLKSNPVQSQSRVPGAPCVEEVDEQEYQPYSDWEQGPWQDGDHDAHLYFIPDEPLHDQTADGRRSPGSPLSVFMSGPGKTITTTRKTEQTASHQGAEGEKTAVQEEKQRRRRA
ncbi:hypothetical protein SCP_0207270 [Sparassis crispa]|uniref:Uncharacterized protein n=1 Tax=Sparassis crispa TaxID=139825 RepID=A0A401GBK3_9APHY|nr:hypothetical protein SCP_0207270 [Sparassis crispa]GBE79527.1 hypothetical protein SCP_0207270 [Sparassis crispa]